MHKFAANLVKMVVSLGAVVFFFSTILTSDLPSLIICMAGGLTIWTVYAFGVNTDKHTDTIYKYHDNIPALFVLTQVSAVSIWSLLFSDLNWFFSILVCIIALGVGGYFIEKTNQKITDNSRAILSKRAEYIAQSVINSSGTEGSESKNLPKFAIFLRPFGLSHSLVVPNTFKNLAKSPEATISHQESSMLFATEPLEISVEILLARLFDERLDVLSVGDDGKIGGFGAVSSYSDQDWKLHTETLITKANKIFLYPGTSPGCIWEIELLIRMGLIESVIIIMPPERHVIPISEGGDIIETSAYWNNVVAVYKELEVALPHHDPSGGLIIKLPGNNEYFIGVRLNKKFSHDKLRCLLYLSEVKDIIIRNEDGETVDSDFEIFEKSDHDPKLMFINAETAVWLGDIFADAFRE